MPSATLSIMSRISLVSVMHASMHAFTLPLTAPQPRDTWSVHVSFSYNLEVWSFVCPMIDRCNGDSTTCQCVRGTVLHGQLPFLRAMAQHAAWDAYLVNVYGKVSYPVNLSQFSWFYYRLLPLKVEPALLGPHCVPHHLEAWVGRGDKYPESRLRPFGFFVMHWDVATRSGSRTFGNGSWAEVMRVAVLHNDEAYGTYYWEARGSGIYLSLGRTVIKGGRLAVVAEVAAETRRGTFDTLQLPITTHLKGYPIANNRFEIISLVAGSNSSAALGRAPKQRLADGVGFSNASLCHLSHRAGAQHEQSCDCDESLPLLNCGLARWRALIEEPAVGLRRADLHRPIVSSWRRGPFRGPSVYAFAGGSHLLPHPPPQSSHHPPYCPLPCPPPYSSPPCSPPRSIIRSSLPMPLPKQPRVAPALAPAPLHMDVPSMGVLYTAHVPPLSPKSKSHPFLLEAARSARLLRSRMSPSYPLAMLANARARLELRAAHVLGLWDVHRSPELLPPLRSWLARNATNDLNPFVHRLSAWLQSPFERTLALDSDIYVLWPRLVDTILSQTLEIGDAAAPLDPGRYWKIWTNAPAPGFCAALFAFTNSTHVRSWLLGAATRLAKAGPPQPFNAHQTYRLGDQEMLWLEWIHVQRGALRLVTLPEEWYCPNVPLTSSQHATPGGSVQARHEQMGGAPQWRTSWSDRHTYPCKSVHSHRVTEEQVSSLLRGSLKW